MFNVIFDMDGTLLDTQRIFIDAWDYAGEKQGIENLGAHIPNVCGMGEPDWTAYLVENFKELDILKFKTDAHTFIVDHLEVKFKKGAKELLEFLKQNGIKMAIASGSNTQVVKHHLGVVEADDYFLAVLGGETVENSKPAPDIFLKAAQAIDANPADCFVIEDSENGIRAGKAAGMQCIGVPDIVQFKAEVKDMCCAYVDSLLDVIDVFKQKLN
ncbi:MAG: HAD family phosphatase [Clostridia bacterium]|nr:HAD family phosphatase [Clostridia bacterium]